jgi:hypothetical protein
MQSRVGNALNLRRSALLFTQSKKVPRDKHKGLHCSPLFIIGYLLGAASALIHRATQETSRISFCRSTCLFFPHKADFVQPRPLFG